MAEVTKQRCSCCGKSKRLQEFYSSNSPINQFYEKLTICKVCLIGMVDSNDIRSVSNALMMINKPFIITLWDSSVVEAEKKGSNAFQIYMKNVVMQQYRDLDWSDSQFGKSETEIMPIKQEIVEEEKVYSKKWLGSYYPSEIEYLEDYLIGLKRDFRILTKSHQDYAKKIAKASLHMDKCFQEMQDGVKGSDKRYKEAKEVFDTLSKSAQFSEDRRGQNDVSLGSFSQIVEMVENNTYVYEHKNDLSKDNYDKLLEEFSHIEKSV